MAKELAEQRGQYSLRSAFHAVLAAVGKRRLTDVAARPFVMYANQKECADACSLCAYRRGSFTSVIIR